MAGLDFRGDREALEDFLVNFMEVEQDDSGKSVITPKYMSQLQHIANRRRTTLEVSLDDLEQYSKDPELVTRLERNTQQYLTLLAEAADNRMPAPCEDDLPEDVFDVLLDQRKRAQEMTRAQMEVEGRAGGPGAPGTEGGDPHFALPPSLLRRYEVLITPRCKAPRSKLRDISADCIGSLVTFRGIVTQVSDVRPLLTVATYLDDQTGFEIYQEVTGKSFNPLLEAPEEVKKMNGGKSELFMQVRGSKFVKYQECKIQESPDEVPQGSTPRTLMVHLRGSLTRSLKAGDSVTLSGIFLPEPYTGARAMLRASLLTATYMEVMSVKQNKQSYQEMALSEEQRAAIEQMTEEGDIYSRLAGSIAPEIYGHEDVKKALLLAMVGGVTKVLPDGMKLRGDIHACLMGDPGVAKSQLLRYVAHISPRAVYTTGKGSSGVGLTAAVMKDPTTNEMVLEGGALVMADKGICCIDEFDKMEEGDRTAIHEVMEQQTVSIAKAGITTTLNTRTTVLAAANPAFGRYDVRRSPAENINLPAALLSRFDILWLILDRPSMEQDLSLAQHVLTVHREGRAPPPTGAAPLAPEMLRAYIAAAKQHEPCVPESLTDYVAAVYAEMRAEEAASDVPHSYTTARTLLSILRLSQALARLRFADSVEQSDVDEALRLMKMSKASLFDDAGAERAADPISQVFSRIRQHAERTKRDHYSWADLLDFLGTSFKPEQIRQCLVDYASINVWQLTGADSDIPGIDLATATA
ncbi:hypothetical protein ABPG77_003470 [Micractinium sp. CCAP 211/92]